MYTVVKSSAYAGNAQVGYYARFLSQDSSSIEDHVGKSVHVGRYFPDQSVQISPWLHGSFEVEIRNQPTTSVDWPQRREALAAVQVVELATMYVEWELRTDARNWIQTTCLWESLADIGQLTSCLPKEPAQEMKAFLIGNRSASELLLRHTRNLFKALLPIAPASAPKSSVNDVENLYEFRERKKVVGLLDEHRDLIPVLKDAADSILQPDLFLGARLSLDYLVDPESDEGEEVVGGKVVIIITTELSADEAFERYCRLQEGWWIDTFQRHGNLLGLDIEFI